MTFWWVVGALLVVVLAAMWWHDHRARAQGRQVSGEIDRDAGRGSHRGDVNAYRGNNQNTGGWSG